MRMYAPRKKWQSVVPHYDRWRLIAFLPAFLMLSAQFLGAQETNQESLAQQIQKLTDSMARTQAQVEESQRQLDEMRKELTALQHQMTQSQSNPAAPSAVPGSALSTATTQPSPAVNATAVEDLKERQALQESQIATHEQTKVESESKYPVKVTGLLLLNGFVNTRAVDMPATPTLAVPGSGSTGASVSQTILGLDARGPHLFGARSYADLRVDFDGSAGSGNTIAEYSGYYNGSVTLLRLRTARAGLQWDHTEAYFSLDHPIFSPNTPTSLTAVAEPALAWSGNLWTWNPQLGLTEDLGLPGSHDLRLQAALVDVGDAPLTPVLSTSPTGTPPSGSEQSRWPGVETRIALLGSKLNDEGSHLGVGGYFAPHHSSLGYNFDAWAATLDDRLRLPARLQLTSSFYRGLALGGLGGGAYKDFVYRTDMNSGAYYFRTLDDVGGWTQLKEKLTERVELNAAFGLDNVFAHELRRYAVPGGTIYQNLARNRTYTGNVIYSPSAYLLFSLEYRHLESSPVDGIPSSSNVIGLGAGYKF
jgi:hypothetical protein